MCLNHEKKALKYSVSLSEYQGQGLALVFGCFTCPVFRSHNMHINDLYENYHRFLPFLHTFFTYLCL